VQLKSTGTQALGVLQEGPPDTLPLVVRVDVELLEPGVGDGSEAEQPASVVCDPDAVLRQQDVLHPPTGGSFIVWTDEPRHRLAA